jgi:hypothetical protein
VATGAGAEFVNVAEAPIKRLVVGKGREAAIAHRLIAVQLHLIRLLDGPRADVIHAQRAASAQLALHSQAPLQKVRRLQLAAGKGVQIHGIRRCVSRRECRLKRSVGRSRRIHGAVCNSGRNADAAHLPVDAAHKDRRIRSVCCTEVSNLRRDNVVEYTASGVQRHLIRQLVGCRSARLPTEKWRAGEQGADIRLNRLIQRLID